MTEEKWMRYIGRPWQQVQEELITEGETVSSVQLLRPPFPCEPLGPQRLVLLRHTADGLEALISHENYRSPRREPRSEEPLRKIDAGA